MRYVYFTKLLQALDLAGLIAFGKEVGLDGFDLAVRPGYPVHPDNVTAELPKFVKALREAGLMIGLVTAATNLVDPDATAIRKIFDACGQAGVPAVKIGYFPYRAPFEDSLAQARKQLKGFADLAAKTGVKACYHTHSGAMLGNNAAGVFRLVQDFDPHHVGVFLDTGHTAVNGGPIRMELDIVRPWLSLIAIKDMAWEKKKDAWQYHVVPAGDGIVHWDEFAQGVKDVKFNGTISLHGEYETKTLAERKELAKKELAFLRQRLTNP